MSTSSISGLSGATAVIRVATLQHGQSRRLTASGWLAFACVVFFVAAGSSCAPLKIRHPVTAEVALRAEVSGFAGVRTWADLPSPAFQAGIAESFRQEEEYYAANPDQEMPATVDLLALSGGSDKGAFGAGLLCGWTNSADRPQFKLVTGVSTGALIAPFAFLGTQCDGQLRDAYTAVSAESIFRLRRLLSLLSADSLAHSEPLAKLLERYFDEEMLEAIAQEHRNGRRLFVATTNLDAQRPVTWDMGAIAASGHPDALKLFRQVLLASASVPVAFPPVYFDVVSNGHRFEEMHVDGGTTTEVFLFGFTFDATAMERESESPAMRRPIRVFVIRNSRVEPVHETVSPGLKGIALRTVDTVVKAHGVSDLYRIFVLAQRDGIDFHLAYIGSDFPTTRHKPFDRDFMTSLFEYGEAKGQSKDVWLRQPPGYVVRDPSELPADVGAESTDDGPGSTR